MSRTAAPTSNDKTSRHAKPEKHSPGRIFDWTDDPEALTQFIFRCKPRGVGIETLLDLLDLVVGKGIKHAPRDTRYAILLAIGEYEPGSIANERREKLVSMLSDWYLNDASSGVHGASGWVLRHLGEDEIAKRIDQTEVPYTPDREWFTLSVSVKPTNNPGTLGDTRFFYTFIVFPEGKFLIGSAVDQPDRRKNEPQHEVVLSRPYAILDRQVSFKELVAFSPDYSEFMSEYDALLSDAGYGPDWYDAVAFCRWLGKEMGLAETDQCYPDPETLDEKQYPRDPLRTSFPRDWPLDLSRRGFRLPTESEWEVAARSGSRTVYGYGSEVSLLDRFGWFTDNSGKKVHPGREKRPSVRGVFDLHGNLYEWTHDWDGDFGDSRQTDPVGAKTGSYRVNRGGSWGHTAADCRSALRGGGARPPAATQATAAASALP